MKEYKGEVYCPECLEIIMNEDEGQQQLNERQREGEEVASDYEAFMRQYYAGKDWWYLIDQDAGWIAKVSKQYDNQ
jgi:hypothetical protein